MKITSLDKIKFEQKITGDKPFYQTTQKLMIDNKLISNAFNIYYI